jgi:hypothetical protein
VDAEEEKATWPGEDIMMTMSATTAATETGTESEMGALATNDYCDPAHLYYVTIRVDHHSAGDRGRL